ncbi:AbrB/MazE/SpoVT family DNA-binding domain-containing protein [Cupriavidus pauculus]|uniref:AbrB/MazE/SpoVT family DNA-binding domain-containing protein n=1 Tax=Cupriavidus pauculus TaxID=82633 RepID=UPI00398BCAC2
MSCIATSTKLNRWGNSLGLRLPQHIVECAGLAAGDYLYIRLLDSGEIMIRAGKAENAPREYGLTDGQSQQDEPELEW